MQVAVIGTGYWGKNLVRNFHALDALAGICDTDANALAVQIQQYPSTKVWPDLATLLEDSTVEAVAIATPAATHGALVRQALDKGKHVFVEKPICLDLAEAAQLEAKAEQSKRTLMVGHLLLYHPAFRALEAIVASGRLGALRYIYSNRASLGKIRQEENALWSFAPHDISMILRLTDAMPNKVVSNGGAFLNPGIADVSLTHFEFPGTVQAHVFVSWLHPFKDQRLVVVGSSGMAVFNDNSQGPEKLLAFDHKVGWVGNLPTIDKAEGVPIPYDEQEPLRLECQHFLDCLRKNLRPRSDAAEAIRVLTVLDACQRSLATGISVKL